MSIVEETMHNDHAHSCCSCTPACVCVIRLYMRLYAGPFVVGFVKPTYTVMEGDDGHTHVEVCVALMSPEGDIGDERIRVEVFHDRASTNIPTGLPLASKLI